MTQCTVCDVTTSGKKTAEYTLELPSERITVRELIRSRVYQEVKDFNVNRPNAYCGLVQPTAEEIALNGTARKARQIDWRKQFDAAIDAFQRCQLLVLIDDVQAQDLEQEIQLRSDTNVAFLKLVPLVGG